MYVSQKIDLVAQPHLEQAAKENGAAPAESSSDGPSAALRAAQAERDAILAEEEEESQMLRDRLRDVGVIDEEEQDELESQTEATERGATSSEWESAWDQESGEEDNKDFILAPKKRRKRGKGKPIERHEGHILQRKNRDEVMTLLGVLHLGMITLRVPIIWADLCTLIRAGRLPYLNVVHQLPADMVAPFPSRAVRKLDPSRVPSVQRLHRKTVALATDLYEVYGIEFPELNSLPILCRFVERMLLPPTFYSAAKSLLAYVDIPMHTVPSESAAGPHWHETEDEDRYKMSQASVNSLLSVGLGRFSTAREIIIMAAIVLVVKMRFGLDGEERCVWH
jgi:RNA polymerase I-specific transcription initiation factor RRN7